MMKNFAGLLSLVLVLGVVGACGEDTVKSGSGSATACAEGESYNPILEQCEPGGFNNSGNVDPGNSAVNNGSNGATNNGATNNGSTNSNTELDAGMSGADASMNDDGGGFDVPDLPCGDGAIIGRACAPSGDILAAADVTISGVDCDGNAFEVTTRTAGDGTFEFDAVPSGSHTLEVTTGSFSNAKNIFVRAGVLNDYTSASAKICVESNVSLAVIEGAYDSVEDVLGTLNLSYDVVGGDTGNKTQDAIDFLSDPTAMSAYDVVLINCGNLYDQLKPFFGIYPYGNVMPTITQALRTFVNQGGSVYISDWASPFFELAFPTLVDFYGDDANVEEARWGYAPQDITATVMSQALQTTLGGNTAVIDFPHNPPAVYNDHWVVPTAVDPSVTVHLQGDATLCQNQMCQNAGRTQAGAPLLISRTEPGGGTVIFTSFHNHSDPSAPITAEMEKILRFLILQL